MNEMMGQACPGSPRDLRQIVGASTAAHESCLAALYVASIFIDETLNELIDYTNSCGGGTDTIGAMAGSIWGSMNGLSSVPRYMVESIERVEIMSRLGQRLYEQCTK